MVDDALKTSNTPMPCYNCGISLLETLAQSPTLLPTPSPCLKYLGLTFYPLDFVYIIPKENTHLYDIGQILSIPNSEEVEVLEYMRLDQYRRPFSEVGASFNLCDPLNKLYQIILIPSAEVLTIPTQRLEGICWTKSYYSMSEDERTAWCSLPDHYVVHGAGPKHSLGFQLHHNFLEAEKRFLQLFEPLRGLELFAGMLVS